MSSNNLFPEFQSAYRSFHSTETTLMRVCNDILLHMNKQHVVLLVFLDLSAAFDTVGHDVLLHRLEHRFGILDSALGWVRSYLANITQRIVIGNGKSSRFDLNCAVPQGSCLGPLFSIYTSELFIIIKQHLPSVHCYSDDTQMYLALKPDDSTDSTEKLIHAFVSSRLDYCIGLLYGLSKKLISKLQRLQNTAARIVYCMPTFCHITPLLFDLHWLPMKFRIDYKIIITGTTVLHLSVFITQHHTTYQVY